MFGRFGVEWDLTTVDEAGLAAIASGSASPAEPLPVRVFSLLMQRRTFAGSAIGGIAETQEMLDFCAEHGISADVKLIAADQNNEAWERVLASDVRYRFVINAATFTG
jgi:uncharacterized zinc-type alcohol dehydrogenase-like protein